MAKETKKQSANKATKQKATTTDKLPDVNERVLTAEEKAERKRFIFIGLIVITITVLILTLLATLIEII